MDATAEFALDGRVYCISAPTALQLTTMGKIVGAHHSAGRLRDQMRSAGVGQIDNIVDVGACIGVMSLVFGCIWPNAKVLALEPHPISFVYLEHNCEGFPNIRPVRLAAGNTREWICLSLPAPRQRPDMSRIDADFYNIGMASRYGMTDRYAAAAEAVPLDDLVDFKPDFIKIDVEGAELTVLEGATRLLQEYKPLVCIELRKENLAMGGTSVAEVADWLHDRGYRCIAHFFDDELFKCQ